MLLLFSMMAEADVSGSTFMRSGNSWNQKEVKGEASHTLEDNHPQRQLQTFVLSAPQCDGASLMSSKGVLFFDGTFCSCQVAFIFLLYSPAL
jgi:hypothetical protein